MEKEWEVVVIFDDSPMEETPVVSFDAGLELIQRVGRPATIGIRRKDQLRRAEYQTLSHGGSWE